MTRKTRGVVLLVALVALAVMFVAVSMLAQKAMLRMAEQRAEVRREEALRRAEGALEAARAALEQGTLQPGGAFVFDGMTVACAATPRGARLETQTVYWPEPAGAPKSSSPRQAVRLTWELVRGQGAAWLLADWRRAREVLAP